MENYYHLKAAAPYSLDSLLPLEIMDDLYAMNMAFVEKYGIHQLPDRWKNSQGVYILFSHLQPGYRFEAYVGQTQKGFYSRLTKHEQERSFWDTAILARRTTSDGFNSMQLNALEGKLRDILGESQNVHVHNQYPTGDKTLPPGEYRMIDEITLSIMRVMFMRGYRNQHMGAQADRLHESITAVPQTPAVPVPPPAPVAPTGLAGALGKLFGVSSPAPVAPVAPKPPTAPQPSFSPPASVPATPPGPAESVNEFGLTPAQDAKFEKLRAWRKQRAIAEGYISRTYLVFDDNTLRHIARASPKTYDDLLRITGIGPSKASKYGGDILKVINPLG